MSKIYVYGDEGCILDQSHGDANTLNRRIIALAAEHGFDITPEWQTALQRLQDTDEYTDAETGELFDFESVTWLADEALDHLNDNAVGTRMHFEVDDNSLYLRAHEPSEDEYRDALDEAYGEVQICGLTYSAAYALEAIDPIAFRVGFSDFYSAAFE